MIKIEEVADGSGVKIGIDKGTSFVTVIAAIDGLIRSLTDQDSDVTFEKIMEILKQVREKQKGKIALTKSKYDLEIAVLSCLILNPDLMKNSKLDDKYFVKHKRMWQFMKAFYSAYGTFDIILMYQQCKDRYQISQYLEWLVEVDVDVNNFDLYLQELITAVTEDKKERYIAEQIFGFAFDLIMRKITLSEFNEKLKNVKVVADKIFLEK